MLTTDLPATALVAVAGLTRTFESPAESVTAVVDADLTANAGEFVLISGPSGSGKSTLLNLIAGLDRPDAGTVAICGSELPEGEKHCAAMRLSSIGVIFQDDRLIEEFTAEENVLLPLEARRIERGSALEEARASMAAAGVDSLAHRFPRELSGGQRQRVGVARAIAGGRKVLLADEPTGALDSANSLECFRVIRALCDQGKTAIVCSHDPQADEFADSYYEMIDGKLTQLR